MKTYTITASEVILQSGEIVTKHYIEYSGGPFDGLKEFYAYDLNEPKTEIREGYTLYYNGDPRNQPDYYKVRAEAGQKLVNDITNKLLLELKSGVRSLADTMAIEVKLDGVISSLNFGQLITAKVKVSQVTGIDTALLNEIKASIDQLNLTHYA